MVAILDRDILWATNRHKNLKYNKGKNTLTGELKLDFYQYNDGKVRRAFFNVEINFNESPKNSILPIVKSIGEEPQIILKKIRNIDCLESFHIDQSDKICLCIPENEKYHFRNNQFDIKIFFKEILEYYIYWINYYGNTGKKLPDYSHGVLGYFELFAEDKINLLNLYKRITDSQFADHVKKDDRLTYIIRCIRIFKPINFKKKKLKIHNKCLCEEMTKKDCSGFLKNCKLLAYNGIRKINIEIKKRKRENINSIF